MIRIVSEPAEAAAQLEAAFLSVEFCANCAAKDGLCEHHAQFIAALAKNRRWLKLIGESYYGKEQAEREKDIATQRLISRKERRAAKRAAELRALVNDIAHPAAA